MAKHASIERPRPKPHRKRSTAQKVTAWVGGLAGVGIAAFVAAFSTTIGNHVGAVVTRPASLRGLPVVIDLVSVANSEGGSYAFPEARILTRSQLAALDALRFPSSDSWFLRAGAVDTSPIDIQLIVQGNRDNEVRITNIKPVASCQVASYGTLFYSPTSGADGSTVLLLNLDNLQPELYYQAAGHPAGEEAYFANNTVSLSRGEQFTFQIIAETHVNYCHFSLDMTVLDGTHVETEVVNNHGTPFGVIATAPALSQYSVLYVGGLAAISKNPWTRVDPKTYRY